MYTQTHLVQLVTVMFGVPARFSSITTLVTHQITGHNQSKGLLNDLHLDLCFTVFSPSNVLHQFNRAVLDL